MRMYFSRVPKLLEGFCNRYLLSSEFSCVLIVICDVWLVFPSLGASAQFCPVPGLAACSTAPLCAQLTGFLPARDRKDTVLAVA